MDKTIENDSGDVQSVPVTRGQPSTDAMLPGIKQRTLNASNSEDRSPAPNQIMPEKSKMQSSAGLNQTAQKDSENLHQPSVDENPSPEEEQKQ